MAKVDGKELYALFYALFRHQTKEKPIAGIQVGDELAESIERFGRKHDHKPGAPESQLTPERVKTILKHVKHDPETRMLVCEDGPDAKRPKTSAEIRAEKDAAEAELQRMVRKFWISASYGLVAFAAAQFTVLEYRRITAPKAEVIDGPKIRSTDKPQEIHPLVIVFLVLIVISAWGIAEAVILAKNLWLDFDRVKGAVPVVGKAWLRRTKRKRREREQRLEHEGEQ